MNQNQEKNELALNHNSMYVLFLELLKIINCEGKIENDEITIWDLFYTPTITLGGKKFTFDTDDVEINTLLGGNGKKYTIPFEYTTNDNLRKIKCNALGNKNEFSIEKTIFDDKEREIRLSVSQEENNLIEIWIPQNGYGIYFKFQINKRQELECSICFSKWTNGIREQIEIKYMCENNSNKKDLMFRHTHLDLENTHSTVAHFIEEPILYSSDNRSGYYYVQHTNSEKRDRFKELNLRENELDVYFEDLCFHAKEFFSILKSNLSSLSPTFLNILFQNYPDFKELLEKIENSQDKGILTNIFNTYLQEKGQLKLKRELYFLPNSK